MNKSRLNKIVISTVMVLSLLLSVLFSVDATTTTLPYIDPLASVESVLRAGSSIIDIAGTVAVSQSDIAANTSRRRYYDTLTAMAQSGNGVYAAKSGSASQNSVINTTTQTINYIDCSCYMYDMRDSGSKAIL